jgi:hypothetical protein
VHLAGTAARRDAAINRIIGSARFMVRAKFARRDAVELRHAQVVAAPLARASADGRPPPVAVGPFYLASLALRESRRTLSSRSAPNTERAAGSIATTPNITETGDLPNGRTWSG